jgi:hypothetical protein
LMLPPRFARWADASLRSLSAKKEDVSTLTGYTPAQT